MSKEAYADSLEHWAKCFRDGTLDDSFANEIAYLLEDKAHDLRVDDRHALSNKLITNALKRGDIPRPQIDWQCDTGICEHSDRIEGRCQCYNEDLKRGDV